jgi:hypothetical protein
VDEVRHWVLFRIVEVARSDDPGMDLLCHLWVAGWCPDRRDLLRLEAKFASMAGVGMSP